MIRSGYDALARWHSTPVTAPKAIRVLLIEDNLDDVVLVRETLKDAAPREFELEAATRLEEALERLCEDHFDIVLLDLTLPDSYGIETFDRLRMHYEVPVVVLSGNTNDELAVTALERGAQDYMVKGTVSGELLVRIIRNALTRYRLTSALQQSEYRLRILSEQLPAVLWTTDEALRFTSSRGRQLKELGLEPDQVEGQTIFDYFGTDNAAYPPIALHKRALEDRPQSSDVNFNGRWYHAHVEPLKNTVGDIIGTIGVALDVTDEQRLRREIEAAHRIQQHLLPSKPPDLRGFEIAGACFPAEQCSGDFFDYIPMHGGRLAVVLADVSGHGFGPAIMAATIRSYLRTSAVLGNQVHEMLALGNRLLVGDSDANPFASVFSASLDPRSRSLQFSSAGHPAYLVRHNGEIEKLDTPCVPIGVRDDEIFPLSRPISLKRDDILVIASDGVFEARRPDREFFGVDRAMRIVREYSFCPAAEIVAHVHRHACEFAETSRLDDDLTVVVAKALSRKRRKAVDADETEDGSPQGAPDTWDDGPPPDSDD